MAAGDVLIGIGGIIGAMGTCISAYAILRNNDPDDADIDRRLNRLVKLKMLEDMENDQKRNGHVDIIFTPIRLLWAQWRVRWAR